MEKYKLKILNGVIKLKTLTESFIPLFGITDTTEGTGVVTNGYINLNVMLADKSAAWFTSKSTFVLKKGQLVYLDDQSGQYKKGDGTTQLGALSFLGGGGSVSGTTGRITVTGSTIDIDSAYVGQNTITTLGTIDTGVWQGTSIDAGYTDAKIKGTIAANQIGFGSGPDTLAGSADFTFNNTTKKLYANGFVGIGSTTPIASVSLCNFLVKKGYLWAEFYDGIDVNTGLYIRKNGDITSGVTIASGNPNAVSGADIFMNGSSRLMAFNGYPYSAGTINFTLNSGNATSGETFAIHDGAHTINTGGAIDFYGAPNTASAGAIQYGRVGTFKENSTNGNSQSYFSVKNNNGTSLVENFKIESSGITHVRGFNATYGISPLNVYAKTAAEGYNYGWSAALNIIPVGGSCYPAINLISGGGTGFSAISWQDTAYDALTGSTAGSQAYLYCYNDGGKGHFVLGVNNNIGTVSPTTLIEALGTALTVGSSGGSLGFYGTAPIAKPTTAFSSGTYAAVGGTTIQTSDTFAAPSGDLYTQPQINRIILTLLGL